MSAMKLHNWRREMAYFALGVLKVETAQKIDSVAIQWIVPWYSTKELKAHRGCVGGKRRWSTMRENLQ